MLTIVRVPPYQSQQIMVVACVTQEQSGMG
jgi:hypothetical protein